MNELTAPADPIAAVTHADPYSYYDQLVRDRPLYYDERLATWIASSADSASAILTSDAFCVRPIDEPIPLALQLSAAGDLFGKFIRMIDGPGHDRMKPILADRAGTLDLRRVSRTARDCAASLLDQLGRPPDWRRFTRDFALKLPALVMTDLLDIDGSEASTICDALEDFARCLSPTATSLEVDRGKVAAERLLAAVKTTHGFIADLTRDVRNSAFDDPTIALANALGLLFQSYEATAGTIGNALIELSRRAKRGEKIRHDAASLSGVVEYVLRNDSPVQNTRRVAAEPVTVLGKMIQTGDRVLVIIAAANRDPHANGRLFTFGAGAHACPGTAIATTIATAALECIGRKGVDLRPIADAITYRPSTNVRIPIFGGETPA